MARPSVARSTWKTRSRARGVCHVARTSIIGPTSVVIGNLSGRGDLEIAGRVQGDVDVLGLVHVREEGTVLGSIRAQDVRIAGHVEGNVTARATLVLQAGANVQGDLVTVRLGIEEGARLYGSVRTEAPEAASDGLRPADAAHDTGLDASERQRTHERRLPAPPSSSRAGALRSSSPRSGELERPSHDAAKRSGPPMPVVPALTKGVRGKRRSSPT